MLARATATVARIIADRNGVQEIDTEFGAALNYIELTGKVSCGDRILLNRTAALYGLGTGGTDFVMARLDDETADAAIDPRVDGHIVKLRYTPGQHTVETLEENPAHARVWDSDLAGFPVVVGQLHSQIAPVAAALSLRGLRCAYIMTDGAALPIALSKLVSTLVDAGLIAHTITAGQAFGGQYETVTVHSALLASKRLLGCNAVMVCQGPGNAGTGTRYGFSGIEQAGLLDAAAALGGIPVAVARISGADKRERHRGISHHTVTALELVRSRCLIALPAGVDAGKLSERHDIAIVANTADALDLLDERGIEVTTMERKVTEDRIFFEAAAAAGVLAADIASRRAQLGSV